MVQNIHEFVGQFKHGGARTGLFQVEIQNPIVAEADSAIVFQAKATTVPALTLNEIEVPYMSRKVYVSGVQAYEPWTITVLEDEDYLIRNSLETWSNYINAFQQNVRKFQSPNPSEYKTIGKVNMFTKDGQLLRLYQMFGIWPQQVGAIDLSWENDTIQEYQVTFRFDYFEVTEGISGNAGGN